MIEELAVAVLMSVGFSLPVFYLCKMQGSFFVVWLAWLISLADGIGARMTHGIYVPGQNQILCGKAHAKAQYLL